MSNPFFKNTGPHKIHHLLKSSNLKVTDYDENINDINKLVDIQLDIFTKKLNLDVLIEKESKKSSNHWAGRTDSNEWVIFEKKSSNIKDIVPVEIVNATGVILHGKEMVGA